MASLDTNAVLRLMLRDVPEQADRVSTLISGAKQGSIMIADAVFFEAVWVMSSPVYGLERPLIGKLLLQVAQIPQINCNRELLVRAVPLYVKHEGISFVDACLAVYAELNEAAPLLTFDRRLVKALPKMVRSI